MMAPTDEQLTVLARLVAATAPLEIDCGEVLHRVAAYLEARDHRAGLAPELAAVRQHLAVCPECSEELDALVELAGHGARGEA